MTKNFLLAATAITAIAFAGAANAGSISPASTVAGQVLQLSTAADKFAPFTIASEAVGPAAAGITGAAVINNKLTTPAFVTAGVKNTYEVVFTPSGGAFDGASTITVVGADKDGGAATVAAYTQLGLRSDGTVAALVEVTGGADTDGPGVLTGGTNITAFVLNTNLKATSEADIKVAVSVNLISSGVRISVDATSATTVAQFKPLLASQTLVATPAAVANTTAALPDYKGFKTAGAPAASADLASAILLKANDAATYAGAKFFSAFNTTAADIGTVVEGGTLTIIGSAGAQLDKLTPSVVGGTIVADTRTDTTVQFTLVDGSSIETGGLTFKLTQPTTALTLNAADYTVSFLPKFNTAYTAPTTAYGPVAAGSVVLEGTNFAAPWFTLNNPNNTAFLRLANNGTVATGPVFVTLKANNGTAAPTTARVQVAASIAPNGILQITGPELATLLGTDAQNGDLQVTVQGDGKVISGKVRVRNVTGALSEQSLGNLVD